ncbi:hypothetical protein CFC21_006088 [Triticum aestivum]|uniref:Uncharacterized protein n=2 Tax=Triticum aestivum TaxID=4565 RepID=A0A9R1DB49_WHEAT|nr:uncharacterized protein LOC119303904 [Triticum dicoccoides]XP_044367003.1 uncharacterized protein LOC123089366 [Triticum aestivum]KAF6988574.1 hypothetical protein CFC21_006088 [Triticum aestivum]
MALSRTAMSVSFLVAVVVAAAAVPAATAQAPCDSACRLKKAAEAFAAAPPTEKAAAVEILSNKTEGAVSSAESANQAAGLATHCLDDCNKLCGAGKKDLACSARCETICRVEVESLSFAADVYAKSSASEKTAVIQAIDKQAAQPSDKINAIAATCIGECGKFCSEGKKDPACATICEDGCRGRAVSVAFALAAPDKKETIKKDIAAVAGPK